MEKGRGMKIVVVGAMGTLGSAIANYWNDPRVERRIAANVGAPVVESNDVVIPLNLPDFDLCSRLFVVETLSDFKPDVVVNAAGVNLIDWLETRANTARNVHANAVANLKEAVRRTGALLVQFGCAEIFYRDRLTRLPEPNEGTKTLQDGEDGQNSEGGNGQTPSSLILPNSAASQEVVFDEWGNARPILTISPDAPAFSELDKPNPASVYAKTKLESERIAAEAPKSLILRTSSIFGETTEYSSGNLVESLLKAFKRTRRLSALNDKIVEPTWAVDVLCALKTLVRTGATGLYHLSGDSRGTARDVAEFIAERRGFANVQIAGISSKEYGFSAPQSAFTALRSVKYGELDGVYRLPDWRSALADYLDWRDGGGK
ncbi:MAG: sugar nucleotide-binding protein [Thermoguttaceae bacterium]|nr:sugar nucleotide-binding protein [Thermoguttaceae bacterium]